MGEGVFGGRRAQEGKFNALEVLSRDLTSAAKNGEQEGGGWGEWGRETRGQKKKYGKRTQRRGRRSKREGALCCTRRHTNSAPLEGWKRRGRGVTATLPSGRHRNEAEGGGT